MSTVFELVSFAIAAVAVWLSVNAANQNARFWFYRAMLARFQRMIVEMAQAGDYTSAVVWTDFEELDAKVGELDRAFLTAPIWAVRNRKKAADHAKETAIFVSRIVEQRHRDIEKYGVQV